MRIAEAMMKITLDDAYWKMYTIVIQAGAILALLLLYLGRIRRLLAHLSPRRDAATAPFSTHPFRSPFIAFICTSVIPALL